MATIEQWHDTIQYSEEGVFIEYIYKRDLVDMLQSRLKVGNEILMSGSNIDKAAFLGYFYSPVFATLYNGQYWDTLMRLRLLHLGKRLKKVLH